MFIMDLSMCMPGMCLLIITTGITLIGIITRITTGLVTGGVAGGKLLINKQ